MSEPDVTHDVRLPWEEDPGELYDHAPCGYLTTLPDGTIVKVNETLLSWTGYTRRELIGRRRFRELLTPGGQIYHETHYAPLLSMQDDVHEIAFDMICADGRRLPTLVNSVLGRDPAGLPRVIRTTIFNATERRGYERELLAARRAAEASERRVRVLQQIVADLAAAPTQAEVAETVVRAPGPAFGATSSSVWLVDEHREVLAAVAGTDPATGTGDLALDSAHVVAEVARRGDLHVIGSVREAEEHFDGMASEMVRVGRSTVVLLPMTTGCPDDPAAAEVLGVLGFSFAAPKELTDSELRVVRLLGQHAGQALDRARLYDQARRREDRAVFLVETTHALEGTQRLTERARRLVDRLVPEIADWARVWLQVGADGLTEEAGGPAPDPDRLAGQIAAVAVSGEPDRDAAGLGCVIQPLVVRGRVLGTLALRPTAALRRVSEGAFLTDLADRAALSLENARLYEQERIVARTLQRSLLAHETPQDPRFLLDTHYQAGARDLEVGGDWYDSFLIGPDRLAVVVGDVVGRGIEAATTMGQLRSAIRALASAEAGPARVLQGLDHFVERAENARMATVVYAEIALDSGEMTYVCAGHPPPLLYEPARPPRYLLDGRSAPLGSRSGRTERIEQRIRLNPGSRLLMYTDGLIERRTRPLDRGLEVLATEYARRCDAPMPGLTAGLTDLLAGREHADDVCLLCVALGAEQRLERSIGADPVQIGLLRQDLRGWLATNSVGDECAQAVLLACSEAVANAIEHGYRDDPFGVVDVTATVSTEAVEIRVSDRGTWRDAHVDVARGRGLQLIRQVMDHVAFDRSDGTTVTMRRIRRDQS
ncbi:SpoIIE family protein phosphatase [Jidongwangia harbinensis]|uniref:SpoIIE family protein phosphatase n=1 Tax=Jidongwangia harbinensis TaxID=2878561 RepID=UPI001CDA0C23|nr:SpoIIE family protein phosphatase [Jidongwangia harbinensis]MCA2217904.1 SpoIIE family protein phosphatase [Jidongwangia harbinensis]